MLPMLQNGKFKEVQHVSGKSDAAIHYLRQYLEFQPDDVDAMMKLADQQGLSFVGSLPLL